MKKKVTILLSTYNGEKYLEEQLQSIYNQTYFENCTLFVRDDGSKDGTVSILKKHEAEGKLILTCGENIGFVKSFFYLIKNAPEADYYSFSDQDDVWKKEKVQRAVEMLEEKNNEPMPLLYCSDYDFCDAKMNFILKHESSSKTPTFYESLTDNRSLGLTMVINKSFYLQLKTFNPEHIFYHDYFMYMMSFFFSEPVYDRISTANYRRHGKNESVSSREKLRLFLWRFKNFFLKQDTNFSDTYKVFLNSTIQIPLEYKKTLELFSIKKTPLTQAKKVFFNHRLRQKIVDEILLRILFLLWRM